jgi:hypothetical protein
MAHDENAERRGVPTGNDTHDELGIARLHRSPRSEIAARATACAHGRRDRFSRAA